MQNALCFASSWCAIKETPRHLAHKNVGAKESTAKQTNLIFVRWAWWAWSAWSAWSVWVPMELKQTCDPYIWILYHLCGTPWVIIYKYIVRDTIYWWYTSMPERHVSATSWRPRRGMYADDEGSHLSRCSTSTSLNCCKRKHRQEIHLQSDKKARRW